MSSCCVSDAPMMYPLCISEVFMVRAWCVHDGFMVFRDVFMACSWCARTVIMTRLSHVLPCPHDVLVMFVECTYDASRMHP